ncbi:hypothetical protein [Ekhidna sp.]|uniref:hypothetical protein n=1 Tax=Ekhidna sp. TaxID=2608089 RepID=UPI00329A32EA
MSIELSFYKELITTLSQKSILIVDAQSKIISSIFPLLKMLIMRRYSRLRNSLISFFYEPIDDDLSKFEFFRDEFISDKNLRKLRLDRILIISSIGVFIIWSGTFIVLQKFQNPGTIGDSFGMVNALFSALAFSFLIYTSLLQTEELRLQRKELKENRRALEKSARHQEEMVFLTRASQESKLIPQIEVMRTSKKDDESYEFLLICTNMDVEIRNIIQPEPEMDLLQKRSFDLKRGLPGKQVIIPKPNSKSKTLYIKIYSHEYSQLFIAPIEINGVGGMIAKPVVYYPDKRD